jgi:hypothetical protein
MEGTLDLATITCVRDSLGDPDQFPYIDSWYFLTLTPGTSWPPAHLTGYIFMHPKDTQPFWLMEK